MYIHGVVGVVLVLVALFGITETLGRVGDDRMRFASPFAAGAGGLLVLGYVGIHHFGHGRAEGENIDTAHWIIGAALLFSAVVVGSGRSRLPWRQHQELAGPFGSIVVGALFLVHGGAGGLELMLHVAIAATLVLSAVAHFSVILASEGGRALRLFAALLLAIGGMLLVFYDARPPLGGTSAQDRHSDD